jgi:hypothetical protein
MQSRANDNQRIRRYLLGDLSDEEFANFEAGLTSETVFDQIAVAEQQLIEEYLLNTLGYGDRQLFETNYLEAEEHVEKVAITKMFVEESRRVAKSREQRDTQARGSWFGTLRRFTLSPVGIISYAILTVFVVALVILGFRERQSLRRQLEANARDIRTRDQEISKLQKDVARLQNERDELARRENDLLARLETPAPKPSESIVAFALSPFATKGPEADHPRQLPSDARVVKFDLKLRPGLSYTLYKVVLNGAKVADGLRPRRGGSVITFQVRSSRLRHGSNAIELLGLNENKYESVDGYSIQIDKR